MLEGVAYGLRDSLELLRELGVEASVGRVSGGGARSELWLQIVASVLGAAARAHGSSDEGAAFGAALLAGVVRRVRRRRRSRRRVRARDGTVEPDPAWTAAYGDGYERFRRLYPALRPFESS